MFGDPCVLARIIDYGWRRWWYRRMTNKGVNSLRHVWSQRAGLEAVNDIAHRGASMYNGMELQLRDIRRMKYRMKEVCKWEVYNLSTSKVFCTATRMKARGVAPVGGITPTVPLWMPGQKVIAAFNDYDMVPDPIDGDAFALAITCHRFWAWQGVGLASQNPVDPENEVFPVPSDANDEQYFFNLRRWHAKRYFIPLRLPYVDAEGLNSTEFSTTPLVTVARTTNSLPQQSDIVTGQPTKRGTPYSWDNGLDPSAVQGGVYVPYDTNTVGATDQSSNYKYWSMAQVGQMYLNDDIPASGTGANKVGTNPLFNTSVTVASGKPEQLEQYTDKHKGEFDKVYRRRHQSFGLQPGQKASMIMYNRPFTGRICNLQKAANPWGYYNQYTEGHPFYANPKDAPNGDVPTYSQPFTGTRQCWTQVVGFYTSPLTSQSWYTGTCFSEMVHKQYPMVCPTDTEYCSFEMRGSTAPLLEASAIAGGSNATELGPGEVMIKKRYRAFVSVWMGKRLASEKFNQRGRLPINETSTYAGAQTDTAGYANAYPTAAAAVQGILRL